MIVKTRYSKTFKLLDNRILKIEQVKNGYIFTLYTEDENIIEKGLLKVNKEISEEQILKELFGYFDIAECEIKDIKEYEMKRKEENIETEIIKY